MALTQVQHDEIEREYSRKQALNERRLQERTIEVFSKYPEIEAVQSEISTLSFNEARNRLTVDNYDSSDFSSRLKELTNKKKELLTMHGFPEDYLTKQYSCSACKDTGYLENSRKCQCRKKAEVDLLYSQSNIENVLETENFSTFNFDYFDSTTIDKDLGKTPLQNIKEIYDICKSFIDDFDKEYSNLYIYGNTGVGKTFLSNCIAKELMDTSHSVIYLSAINLFHILADKEFNRAHSAENGYIAHHLTDCDLLIIDDLGTEIVNSFTVSSLFQCLNERILNRKPVIISTNLSLGEFQKHYSERILSRVIDNYKMLKIIGNDIRIM